MPVMNGLQATQLIRSFEETGNWDAAIKAGIEPCAPSSASVLHGQSSIHDHKRIPIIAVSTSLSITLKILIPHFIS
jgi:CheY-like chemotaxis protein